MKLSVALKILAVVIVASILIGLFVWTVTSPPTLSVQSVSDLQNGLFGGSSSKQSYNVTDGSGTYQLAFGLQYDQNITAGSMTRIAVYIALESEKISSSFTKGIALTLESSTLSIDGKPVSGVQITSSIQDNLQTYYFALEHAPVSSGNHSLEVGITVSTIDVNYIGSVLGNYQPVNLNGTINISQ